MGLFASGDKESYRRSFAEVEKEGNRASREAIERTRKIANQAGSGYLSNEARESLRKARISRY